MRTLRSIELVSVLVALGIGCGGADEASTEVPGEDTGVDARADSARDDAAIVDGGDGATDASVDAETAPPVTKVTLAVLGDIAQAGRTQYARANAALITKHVPKVSGGLLFGDLARQPNPPTMPLKEYFDTHWKPATAANFGQFDAIAFPVPGNHEYFETNAKGYFDYFATRLDAIKKVPGYSGVVDTVVGGGYYAFDLNGWRIYALNTNGSCDVFECKAGSPQETWLKTDLAKHVGVPTIAYWHEPRFTCGGGQGETAGFWNDLFDAKADLVFAGHTHYYQRWKPLNKAGAVASPGLTQLIVGSGGVTPGDDCTDSAGRIAKSIGGAGGMGVLFLTLGSDGSYAYEYRVQSDGSVFDSGSGKSRNAR